MSEYLEQAEKELKEEKDFLNSKVKLIDLDIRIKDSRELYYYISCLAAGIKDDEKTVKDIKAGKRINKSLNGGVLIHYYMIDKIKKLLKIK